ncbi:MAG: hypothetical protein M3Z03_16585 [Actinomycetota bacterium]|nr:hypothetical protein [Actinomycetota bacterium]
MTRRRRIQLACVAVVLAAIPVAAPSAGAQDEVCSTYSAVAAADGVRVAYDSPGFLVIEHVDLGAPVAQVAVDAFGTSTSYAAYPDPSDEILSLLPVVGISRDIYPLVIDSQYPSRPEGRISTPLFNLATNTAAHYARSVADSGVGIPGLLSAGLIRATAGADCSDTGIVTARAESLVDGIALTGDVSLGRVRTVAQVEVGADGQSRVTSDIELSLLTIAGLKVELSTAGLETGSAIPIPDLGLNQLLGGAGVTLTYLAAEPQPDGKGVTAPAVRLTLVQDLSGGGSPTEISITLGRAFASADGAGAEPDTSTDIDTTPLSDGVDIGAIGPSDGAFPEVGAPELPRMGSNRDDVRGAVPLSTSGPFSASALYAVLVVGAGVVLSSGLLFKTLGVKVGWR